MIRISAVAAGVFALVGNAGAQSGTITFIGEVIEQTCVVQPGAGGGTADFSVVLPDAPQRQLASAGSRGTPTPFELVVGSSDRPCRQAQVRGSFANLGDTNAAGRLSNRGSAGNVEVVVLDAQGADIDLANPASAQIVAVDEGIGRLRWQANYHATAAAGSGNVISRVQYLVDYP